MSEARLQRSIMGALAGAGVWVIRVGVSQKRGKSGTQSGEPGMPDLHMPGLGWFEVKLPGEILSTKQALWHQRAAKLGVRVATVSSVLEALTLATLWRIEVGSVSPQLASFGRKVASSSHLSVVR